MRAPEYPLSGPPSAKRIERERDCGGENMCVRRGSAYLRNVAQANIPIFESKKQKSQKKERKAHRSSLFDLQATSILTYYLFLIITAFINFNY